LATVLDLDRGDDLGGRLLHDGEAGDLRAGVDLDPVLVHDRVLDLAILEEDREGVGPEHCGPALRQQDPCPCRRARIEGLSVGV
jgi:hypothetical protein